MFLFFSSNCFVSEIEIIEKFEYIYTYICMCGVCVCLRIINKKKDQETVKHTEFKLRVRK